MSVIKSRAKNIRISLKTAFEEAEFGVHVMGNADDYSVYCNYPSDSFEREGFLNSKAIEIAMMEKEGFDSPLLHEEALMYGITL